MNGLSADILYELHGVQQIYNGRTVLDVDELQIKRGEVLGLVGPSGAGKSTLLRLLAFLEQPAAGVLDYEGRTRDEAWPDLNGRRRVTMVFQNPHLLRRSVSDNVSLWLDPAGQREWAR